MIENKNYKLDFTQDDFQARSWLLGQLTALKAWLNRNLGARILFTLLFFACTGLAMIFASFGPLLGLVAFALLVGIPMVLYSIVNLRFGVITVFSFSFFLQGLNKYAEGLPLGVILDIFLLVMLVGLILAKWKSSDLRLAKNPISYVVWAWIVYNCLEFFNPMASMEAWLFVIRGVAILMIFYFILLQAMNGMAFCKKIINIWICLSLLGALYGLFQEFHGLLPFEKNWVQEDEFRFKLIYNWGRYRTFSFFNDPTIFGVLMSFTGLLCVTLLTGPFTIPYKIFLAISACVTLLAMVYAGTRTAFAMFPAGFIFYSLLTFQKKTLAFTTILMLIGCFIIFSDIRSIGPFLTTNSINRIRSAFSPSEDPSFQVREKSQEFIKPFIQSHPIGAGLGSIGIWGSRFTPNSALSDFAPDSGYVRVAVELGWLGLGIYCLLFMTILIMGIRNYHRIRNPQLKAYMAAIVSVAFSLVIGNYPQQVLIQVPTILIFYAIMAMIVRLREFDELI